LSWIVDFQSLLREQPGVLVTLNLVSGSAPRDSGSRMMVTADQVTGSVGGGNLEFQAVKLARDLLQSKTAGHQEMQLYGLGPALNQCCGGAVALLYEVFDGTLPGWLEELQPAFDAGYPVVLAHAVERPVSCKLVISTETRAVGPALKQISAAASDLMQRPGDETVATIEELEVSGETWWLELVREVRKPIVLFGAGHVGQAVIRTLSPLPFSVTWVDSRTGVFPAELPAHVRSVRTDTPLDLVAEAPAGSFFIVMTHSHQTDEDICFEVLQRDDYAWLGLIGSDTKRRRFVHRLEQRGIEPARLDDVVCPIGLAGIHGKQPATIALSLAAQLMSNNKE
jgi:xanthine dehydrogenase accessory factor